MCFLRITEKGPKQEVAPLTVKYNHAEYGSRGRVVETILPFDDFV